MFLSISAVLGILWVLGMAYGYKWAGRSNFAGGCHRHVRFRAPSVVAAAGGISSGRLEARQFSFPHDYRSDGQGGHPVQTVVVLPQQNTTKSKLELQIAGAGSILVD